MIARVVAAAAAPVGRSRRGGDRQGKGCRSRGCGGGRRGGGGGGGRGLRAGKCQRGGCAGGGGGGLGRGCRCGHTCRGRGRYGSSCSTCRGRGARSHGGRGRDVSRSRCLTGATASALARNLRTRVSRRVGRCCSDCKSFSAGPCRGCGPGIGLRHADTKRSSARSSESSRDRSRSGSSRSGGEGACCGSSTRRDFGGSCSLGSNFHGRSSGSVGCDDSGFAILAFAVTG